MVIYVEYLILNNFCITYLICDLSYVVTMRKKSRVRAVIASIIATVTSFLYLFLTDQIVATYILKAVLWIVLSLILYLKKQNVFLSALVFLLTTMLIGGAITFVSTVLTPAQDAVGGRVVFTFPIGVLVILGYVFAFVIKRVSIALLKNKTSADLIRTVKIGVNGKTLILKGFVDTGNRLIDGKSGLPVVIVKASAVIEAFSPAMFASLIEKGRSGNCISYTTVTGGVNRIMLIYPELFVIEGKKDSADVAVGISFGGFYGDYDVILHPSIV